MRVDQPTYDFEIHPDGYALLPLHDATGSVVAHTKVDPIDASWLRNWRWSVNPDGYAYRVSGRTLPLHRVLLGLMDAPRWVMSDHINRDRLDNRRVNLRPATPAENRANTAYRRPRRGV